MDHGTISFAGLDNLGARMTHVRGVRPSRCVMRVVPQNALTGKVGQLVVQMGGTIIVFEDAAIREVALHAGDRHRGPRHEIIIEDRRYLWRYVSIDGVYNRRLSDGTIHPDGKKTARELATILFSALGDASADVSAVPETTWPTVVWHRARASLELESLLARFGQTVVLKRDNTFKIVPIHEPSGTALPSDNCLAPATLHSWKSSTIPSSLRIQGDPTVFQSALTLAPLDFTPSTTWVIDTGNWPEWKAEVNQLQRTEAFLSGYRYFYVTGGWEADGETVNDHRQLEILDHLVEVHPFEVGILADAWINTPPVIFGDYYRWDEMGTNTSSEIYTGKWRFLPGNQIVHTDKPLFKLSGSSNEVAGAPTLSLIAAYRVRKVDGSGYVSYTRDKSVTGAPATSNPRVIPIPELAKKKIADSPWLIPIGDNAAALNGEADAYLNELEKLYTYDEASAYFYAGFVDIDLDGAISQMTWSCGEFSPGEIALTLIGRHTEPDTQTIGQAHAELFRQLGQLTQRAAL